MNYYNRHIGDYAKQTGHLTFAEDGAYNRMLDYYYASEQPLPLERDTLYRKMRARSKPDREMIDRLLTEFFDPREDGWHKNRCDEEISKALEDGEENAAKRENERERQRRHRKRRKELFAALREHGIVPKWDTPLEQLETDLSHAVERNGNAPVTRTATRTATAVPIANSQEPVPSTSKSTPLAPSDFSLEAGDAAKGKPKNGHKKPFEDGPTVIAIPLLGGKEYEVHQSLVDELDKSYPAVDALQTLREIRSWNLLNERERKTSAGILRHINRWFAKEQNRG